MEYTLTKNNSVVSKTDRLYEPLVHVADDGRGLHREKILARTRARGLGGVDEEPEDQNL